MNYHSDKMNLNCIQIVFSNPVNDVLICRDMNGEEGNIYTVIAIKQHEIAKKLLEVCANENKPHDYFLIDHFSYMGQDIWVFPYAKERPISRFYTGDSLEVTQCEDVCRSLVLNCISCGLPFPILYMVLTQGLIHISKELSVYFSYGFDLRLFDETKTEQDCVVECAKILLSLLETKSSQKAISYKLLQKRTNSMGYHLFAELYKDIIFSASYKGRLNIIKKFRIWFDDKKDSLFQVLLVICVILISFAVVSILTQLIFGDVPWLRVFVNSFKQIGTESLLQ